jgi:drug/metabolite transporter (DMT)-like permease
MAAAAGWLGITLGLLAAPPPPQMAWAGVGLALSLGFLASNLALQYGASRMNAHAAALIMLSEVVFASLSAVALGAAEMNARTVLGGTLILAAAVWSAWPDRDAQRAQPGAQ